MHTTYVENITAFISNMRPSRSEESKPVGPVPVITIDGVDYYHKQEFDLTKFDSQTSNYSKFFDVLTGEEISNISQDDLPVSIRYRGYQEADFYHQVVLILGRIAAYPAPNDINIYVNPDAVHSPYTSKAFDISETKAFNDKNHIYLPTCSAYYGFISEDGKTFISYYNIKGE